MTEKIQVLIVDDEVRFARNVSRLLDKTRFNVCVSHNGLDALEKVHKPGRMWWCWTSACRKWTVLKPFWR